MLALQGLLAYIGPETFLPITSVIATLAGLVLMFWRTGLRLLRQMVERVRGTVDRQRVPNPHFARQARNQPASYMEETVVGDGSLRNDA